MVPILALAFALRAPLLDGPRFHPDEALFASFARDIAVSRDPFLAVAPLDKPPLLFYLQALFYSLSGPRELAARLPCLCASMVTIALAYRVTARLAVGGEVAASHTGWRGGTLAAIITALSPLSIAFGATAFTDTLMVAWGMAALLSAAKARPGWAGFWLGLGLATKYQALFFLPLAAGLLWLAGQSPGRKSVASHWARLVGGTAGPLAAVATWDLVRSGALSLIGRQAASYGAMRLLRSNELWPRLIEWAEMGRYLLPPPWFATLLALILAWGLARRSRTAMLLGAWMLGYFLIHWLLNIHPWDRYLLPAVPVIGVLAGWSLEDFNRQYRRPLVSSLLLVAVAVALLPAAVAAAEEALPIGGDHGTFDGIEQVAAFFADHPYGTVLYDHWLSWELRYYLFDSRVYVSWFPDAAALIEDLRAFGSDPPRYVVVPGWESPLPLLQAAAASRFAMDPVLDAQRRDGTISFTLYQISE